MLKQLNKKFAYSVLCATLALSMTACKSQADKIYEEGLGHYQDKDYLAAVHNFQTVITEHADDDVVEKAVVKKDDSLDQMVEIGDTALSNGAFLKAVNFYEDVLTYRPDSTELQRKLKMARQNVIASGGHLDVVESDDTDQVNVSVEQPDIKVETPDVVVENKTTTVPQQTRPQKQAVNPNTANPSIDEQVLDHVLGEDGDENLATTRNQTPTRPNTATTSSNTNSGAQTEAQMPRDYDQVKNSGATTETTRRNGGNASDPRLSNGEIDCYSLQGQMKGSTENAAMKEFPMTINVCESSVDSSQVKGSVTISWPDGSTTTDVEGQLIPNKTFLFKQPPGDKNGRFNGQKALRGERTAEGSFSFYDSSSPNYKWHAVWSDS